MSEQVDGHQRALERVYAGRMAQRDGYYEVPSAIFIEKVTGDMPDLPAVAFFRFAQNGKPEQIREPNEPLSPIALLIQPTLWVRKEDVAAIRAFAESKILAASDSTDSGNTPALPLQDRMAVLRRSAILVCEDLFNDPSPENIDKSVKMVSTFVYSIMKEPNAYLFLSALSNHDPYTLRHSVGTSVHCIILGRKLGITDEKELTELGTAGLLHDIGKTRVKREIINKNSPLDEDEWDEMKGHVTAGFDIVKDNPLISDRAKNAILEHHEARNATGNPPGKKSAETDLFSRFVGIGDAFKVLTTDRGYSKPRTP